MANPTQPFTPAIACTPVTKVEISVSCRHLKQKDLLSKSDPMCVLFMRTCDTDQWLEVGRTETVRDTLDPNFVTKFLVDYYFEERQQLMFKMYDVDSKSVNLQNHDFLGQVASTLGELVAYQGRQVKLQLTGLSGDCGTILLTVEEVLDCKRVIDMQWQGKKLDSKDWFGKSDPFLEFCRVSEDNSYTAVFRTEVVKRNLNPTWRPFTIQMRQLSGGDDDRTLRVACYDWDLDGGMSSSHDLIGEFHTNVRTLSQGPGPANEYKLINKKKQAKKKSYKHSGVVKLISFTVREQATFLDYIQGGLQMHFTVAVDFTASNGDPRDPASLHFLDPVRPNAYAMAIRAVGEVIQDYDSDKMFPALGFGARLPPDGRVSHEFFLNGSPTDPYCAGIQGVLEAYQRTLQSVQLYGPTNFSSVIHHVAKFASTYRDGRSYFVLLIITDGVISDMPQTMEAIVQASSLPMSIIIVGVGNADFSAMEVLDGDVIQLNLGGQRAERDIVQFVPFRKFLQSGASWQSNQAQLAKEVLAEIPGQVTAYMSKCNIKPGPIAVPQGPS
ncbi:copine-8-like isoform X1 [Dermacentor andersoni]|uniref:copine-8-like isoform X1 n=2 Tax=Dermacentor andersoni TaxID=34620 RepID=UPI002155D7BB|nr:copine-8-like isoform X1 [Dermacentor andersoni]